MVIKYLGTAAYEGVPALYCKCRVCAKSAREGGRALRTRSQALVDGELLLDFNADTVSHFLRYGIDCDKIGDCLITHSHCDHLYPDDLEILSEPYSHEHRTLHFYAGEDGYRQISRQAALHGDKSGITASLVRPGETFFTSGKKYKVLALRANHAADTSPLFYAIEREGKRLLYAHDTGVFFEEVYPQLKAFGRLDFVSLDCTGCLGLNGGYRNGHMCLTTALEVIGRLKKEGIADENTLFAANHFSHNGGQTYGELVPALAEYGIRVAYDGMEVSF